MPTRRPVNVPGPTRQAVQVDVGHLDPPGVDAAYLERRARHWAGDAERAARAAHEGRLAGAELAAHDDDVAGAQVIREPRPDRLGPRGPGRLFAVVPGCHSMPRRSIATKRIGCRCR